jgi:hypothetical protein
MIERIIVGNLSARSLFFELELGAKQLGRADRDNRAPGRGTV